MDAPKTEDLAAILKVNNIDLASVVPKIEFYKIYEDAAGNIEKEIYIPYAYDARKYAENIYGNREQRGDDVGIKNVSFVYDEQNPAVAETLLGCSIDFVFANAEALVTKRNAGFRYADLFAFASTESNEVNERRRYDIVLKIGYQLDGAIQTLSADVKEALKKQERMIRLGMVGYDVEFKPNGMLFATVQYKSSNINFFSGRKNEIFGARRLTKKKDAVSDEPSTIQKAQGVTKVINPTQADASDDPTERKPQEDKPAIDLQALYSGIQTYMAENCMIHKFDASLVDSIAEGDYYFSNNPCVSSGLKNDMKDDISGQLIQTPENSVEDIIQRFSDTTYEGKRTITFFYFGDLIDAILATNPDIVESMKTRKFAFLLDNVGYQFLKGRQISVFNIAKLPIAQSVFNQWFSKNIVAKEKKIVSLLDFIKSYVLQFAVGILRLRSPDQIGSDYNSSLVRRLINVPDGLKDNKGISGFTDLVPINGRSSYGKAASTSDYEYYTIYDESFYNDQLSALVGTVSEGDRYARNIADGVPHFYIGADRGLLKEFSFQKSGIGSELATARNLEPGSPYKQLWAIFDINATFIGNNLLRVGKNIYLDPSITGLGQPFKEGTVSNIMGLGGYYMISRVEHSYYPKWTTSVTAISTVPANIQSATTSKESIFTYF